MANWYSRNGSTSNFDAATSSAGVYTSTVWNSASDGSGSWLSWQESQTINDAYAVGDNFYINSGGWFVTVNLDLTKQCNLYASAAYFIVADSRNIAANCYGVSNKCIYIDANCTVTITGNVTGGSSTSAFGVQIAAGRTVNLTINGCVTAGTGTSAYGIYFGGSGSTLTVNNGASNAVIATSSRLGIYVADSSSVINIIGNIVAASTNGHGISITNPNVTVNVTGNVYGGAGGIGIYASSGASNCSITVVGNVNGGTGAAISSGASGLIVDITGNITSLGTGATISLSGTSASLTQRGGNITASGTAGAIDGSGISISSSNCNVTLNGNIYGGQLGTLVNVNGIKHAVPISPTLALTVNGDVYAGLGWCCHGICVSGFVAFTSYSVIINGNIYNNNKALGVAAPYTAPNSHLNFLQNPMAGGLTGKFSKLPSASPFRRINKRYV